MTPALQPFVPSLLGPVLLSLVALHVAPALMAQHVTTAQDSSDELEGDAWAEARQLYLAAEFDAARARIEAVIAAQPDRYDTWEAWVATYRPGPRLKEADDELRRRLAHGAENPRLLFAQALVARYGGELERARTLFAAAADLDPTSEVIPYEHRSCFAEKHPRFMELMQQACELNAGNLAVLGEWSRLQLNVEKSSPDAVEAAVRANFITVDKAALVDFVRGAIDHHRKPKKSSHNRRSVELLEKFASARPGEAQTYRLLARLYRDLGDHEKGFRAVEQGQRIAWWWPVWMDELEYLTYLRDGAEAALERSHKFVEFFPDDWRAWQLFGLDLYYTGQYDAAIDALKKAVQRDFVGSEPTPRWNLGLAYRKVGRASEAVDAYLGTLIADPYYLSQRDVSGPVLAVVGELTPDQRQRLDERIAGHEAESGFAWPLFLRGALATVEGRVDEEEQVFKTILRRFPKGEAAPLTYWGQKLVRQGRPLAAKDRFIEALRRDVSHSKAFDGMEKGKKTYPALRDLFSGWKGRGQVQCEPLSEDQADDVIEVLRRWATEHANRSEPLIYLAEGLETLGDRRGAHQLYEDALVLRLKVCALNRTLPELEDEEKSQGYRVVADSYASLGRFDEAYDFYIRAGNESYREARAMLQSAAGPANPFPPPTTRKREADTDPFAQSSGVNIRNANFHFNAVDMTFDESSALRLSRHYNSRSGARGPFGSGWSSDFTVELGSSDDWRFAMRGNDGFIYKFGSPDQLRRRMEAEVLRRLSVNEGTATDKIRKRLGTEDVFLRQQAIELGLWRQELTWLIRPGEQIPAQAGHGLLYLDQGSLVFYDARNKTTYWLDGERRVPVAITHPARGDLLLEYDGRRLAQVTDPAAGEWIKFEYDENGRIERATDSRGREVAYIHAPDGRCLASRNTDGDTYGFLYDGHDNLTAIRHSDGRTQTMRYHARKDWAMSLRHAGGHPAVQYEYFSGPSNDQDLHVEYDGNTFAARLTDLNDPRTDRRASKLYGSTARAHWLGKTSLGKTILYRDLPENSGSDSSEILWDGSWSKEVSYEFSSEIVQEKKRWVLERGGHGQRASVLKPTGDVVRLAETIEDRFQYDFGEAGRAVLRVSVPNGPPFRVSSKYGHPLKVEGPNWQVELVRDQDNSIVDYRLFRDHQWRSIGRQAVQRLRAAMNVGEDQDDESGAWKLGEPVHWTGDQENAELAFLLNRLHDLFETMARAAISEHALHCESCFRDEMEADFHGYELEAFERQFLPQ